MSDVAGKFDVCWLKCLLGLVGETIDMNDDICGVVVGLMMMRESAIL